MTQSDSQSKFVIDFVADWNKVVNLDCLVFDLTRSIKPLQTISFEGFVLKPINQ